MLINNRKSCFITLKDHKIRLVNPAKIELSRISKSILDRINASPRNLIKVNHWKDASMV